MERRTIERAVRIQGVGLHRGRDVQVDLRPAEDGIVFIREGQRLRAAPENIVDTRLNTMLGNGTVSVSTIEHLMSALAGLGITDCHIAVDGDEMPALDGSALPYVELLRPAGLRVLGEVAPLVVRAGVRVGDDDVWIEALPGPFAVEYGIDFPEPAIGRQSLVYAGDDYERLIAPARTFGRLCDVDMMRAMGLSLGGGLHNAVVVDGDRILNPEGLRFPDEFVRHKVLDCLGDLWLLGRPVTARIRARKANHRLHVELVRRIAGLAQGTGDV